VAQIADETSISPNYLYRATLPLDESGVKFPLEYLVPLMNATKNYTVLDHIAKLCGFLLVKVPKFKSVKMDNVELLSTYQDATVKAVNSLKEFLANPTAINYQKVDESLRLVMEKSVQASKFCDKTFIGQTELDLNN